MNTYSNTKKLKETQGRKEEKETMETISEKDLEAISGGLVGRIANRLAENSEFLRRR